MIIVYVTYPSVHEAQALSKRLLEARLVACANILAAHQALYWWEGKIQEAAEVGVLYKTQPALFGALKDTVLAYHPYDCPCIVSWPIAEAHPAFLQWIAAQVK
jgi:periplasmic divalent cation tolerance protein